MIITKTPFRISFFGGGTDFPSWYLRMGGAVLSTTIDKYCYISCRYLPPFFNVKYRIVWSHIESVSSLSEILHPAVRGGIKFLGLDDPSVSLEIHHQGDLPARTGMGSSSAFAVGLIKALSALKGEKMGHYDLALKAIELEQVILKDNVGSQDQVAASYGGFNVINFLQNGTIRVEPVTIRGERVKELHDHLLLFYTGHSRNGSDIAGHTIANIEHQKDSLLRMHKQVEEAVEILRSGSDIEQFGELLYEGWRLKRSLSKLVSNDDIDKIYEKAMANGAIGGKLLGSGGAGFMLFFVPPKKQPVVIDALDHLLHVPFQFESEGSTLLQNTVKRDPHLQLVSSEPTRPNTLRKAA